MYAEFINNILETRGRDNVDGYCEVHHIIPRCMGGDDSDENLISLYPKEHYEAHRMLYEENKDNKKLAFAWWAMSNMDRRGGRYKLTKEEYEEVKSEYVKAISCEVYCLETKTVFSSVHDAGNSLGISIANICNCCNQISYSTHGKHFMFMSDFRNSNMTEEECIMAIEENRCNGGLERKPIICLETLEIFKHAKLASVKYGGTDSIGAINDCCRGKNKTAYGKHWMFLGDFNKISKDPKDIISEIESNRRYGGTGTKKILCLETNEIFNKSTDVQQAYNISASSIRNCLTHRAKTSVGKHWIYLDEFNKLNITKEECINMIDNKSICVN